MSLMLPRLIDDLLGRVNRSQLIKLPGSELMIPEFVALARKAEKFSFGEIPLELDPDPAHAINGRPIWIQPMITKVEHEAWDEGLIPLPAPVCWFEFILGGEPSGMLVLKTHRDIKVQRVDYEPKKGTGVFTGVWVERSEAELDKELRLNTSNGASYFQRGDQIYRASGPQKALDFIALAKSKGTKVLNLAADHYLTMYLTLMLYSSTTEFQQQEAPAKLNKARVKSGHEPLPPHRIVTIVPGRYLERKEAQGGTHASPRLHWRRSHKRHFDHQTGNARWLGNEVYKGQTGWYVTIVPRCLVGLAELGEVSHEYRIQHPNQ
jgi:hypothetical protein